MQQADLLVPLVNACSRFPSVLCRQLLNVQGLFQLLCTVVVLGDSALCAHTLRQSLA